MYKITNRTAASGIVIHAKIEIDDTFSCILYILWYLIMTIIICAPFCYVCMYRIYVALFHFPHFLFLTIVYLTVLNDLMIYNDESIGWVMSYGWLIHNCFSQRSYKVPVWQAKYPQFHHFIPSETVCVVNGPYWNDHLMDISEYSLLYGEK